MQGKFYLFFRPSGCAVAVFVSLISPPAAVYGTIHGRESGRGVRVGQVYRTEV